MIQTLVLKKSARLQEYFTRSREEAMRKAFVVPCAVK